MIAYLSGAPLLPCFMIRQADGRQQTFPRDQAGTRVEIKDPLEPHKAMLLTLK